MGFFLEYSFARAKSQRIHKTAQRLQITYTMVGLTLRLLSIMFRQLEKNTTVALELFGKRLKTLLSGGVGVVHLGGAVLIWIPGNSRNISVDFSSLGIQKQ